jgi:hypothetical protein
MGYLDELAPGLNAFTTTFDPAALGELQDSYRTVVEPALDMRCLDGGELRQDRIEHGETSYYVTSFGHSPLLWISGNNSRTHEAFCRFYDRLDVEEEIKHLVDHDRNIVVYCGFFVVGNRAEEERWHVDHERSSQGLTLLTPLFEPDAAHAGLLYYDQDSRPRTYDYRVGEAIVFGDDFYHSTGLYPRTESIRVLVSMTLGTDKLEYWPKLERTVGRQSEFLILPCGHQRGTCDHLPS